MQWTCFKSEKNGWKDRAFVGALLLVALAATGKALFFGIDIDEQYAVALGYRMAQGDHMFLEMWEPHQTSGFLAAALIKLYWMITGGLDGLVLFLRASGAFFQALISMFVYVCCTRLCSRRTAFVTAVFYYNLLPKYSQTPDFSNMLLWFGTLMFLTLFLYFQEGKGRIGWLIAASISTALLVLAYPTCVIVVLPVCLGILRMSARGDRLKNLLVYGGVCLLSAGVFLGFILSHMSVEEFVFGIRQMLADGSHGGTWLDKYKEYRINIRTLLPYLVPLLLTALVLWLAVRLILHSQRYSFLLILLLCAVIQQFYVWIWMDKHLKFPGLFYAILSLIGIWRYIRRRQYGADPGDRRYTAVFWFGNITALFMLLAALLASNMRLYESNEYMAIGLIASLVWLEWEQREAPVWWLLIVLGVVGTVSFRKGFLQYQMYGKDTIFVTKQKALSGPLDGVYCRWSDGVDYNLKAELLQTYVPRGSKVMYVGLDNLVYLMGEYEVCNFSTISTPVMNERLLEYWDHFPDKYPAYIVWDSGISSMYRPKKEIKEQMLADCTLIADEEGIQIYQTPAAAGMPLIRQIRTDLTGDGVADVLALYYDDRNEIAGGATIPDYERKITAYAGAMQAVLIDGATETVLFTQSYSAAHVGNGVLAIVRQGGREYLLTGQCDQAMEEAAYKAQVYTWEQGESVIVEQYEGSFPIDKQAVLRGILREGADYRFSNCQEVTDGLQAFVTKYEDGSQLLFASDIYLTTWKAANSEVQDVFLAQQEGQYTLEDYYQTVWERYGCAYTVTWPAENLYGRKILAIEEKIGIYSDIMDFYDAETGENLAQVWGMHWFGDNPYFVDLDGDGRNELISSVVWGDGATDVEIYLERDGKILRGAGTDLIPEEKLPHFTSLGMIGARYLPETNQVQARWWNDQEQRHETQVFDIDIDRLKLYPYEPWGQ